jgi:hypothetical protein
MAGSAAGSTQSFMTLSDISIRRARYRHLEVHVFRRFEARLVSACTSVTVTAQSVNEGNTAPCRSLKPEGLRQGLL